MLISYMVGATAAFLMQPDATRAPREAFSRCLFTYADNQAQDRMELAAFETALAQQCQREERAFRDALRTQQAALRVPAAEIEEITTMEVDDARANTKARFEDAITPR